MIRPRLSRLAMNTDRTPDELNFDTAVPVRAGSAPDGGAAAPEGATCCLCQQALVDEYYAANGQPVCQPCSMRVAELAHEPRGMTALAGAMAYGIGAAIAGAVLYYAVIAITEFEIGIVAIAIGYMVGYAVRRGASGRGGRRLQVVAVVLTYWAVGLAYTPLAFKAMADQAAEAPPNGSASAAAAADQSTSTVEAGTADVGLAGALAALFALTFALPVLMVVGSLPGGLLSAAIIGFGMHQAWRMTGVTPIEVTGPHRVGPALSTNP